MSLSVCIKVRRALQEFRGIVLVGQQGRAGQRRCAGFISSSRRRFQQKRGGASRIRGARQKPGLSWANRVIRQPSAGLDLVRDETGLETGMSENVLFSERDVDPRPSSTGENV